jgi:hypothetical protein
MHMSTSAIGEWLNAIRRRAFMVKGSRISAHAASCLVVCLALVATKSARAQAPPDAAEGMVVQIERDDLVVDLGARRGASSDEIVEIWRPIRVKHPVTGKMIVDRFPIGHLRFVQVRPNLSLARPEGQLSRDPEAGDVVLFAKAAASPPPLAPPSAPASGESLPAAQPALAEDETVALSALFDSLHGADLAARIAAYEGFAAAHPRYRAVLTEEAASLRKLFAPPAKASAPRGPEWPRAEMQPIYRVVADEPLRIAMTMSSWASGAVLHARTSGDVTYSTAPMTKVGADYWAATIPRDRVRAPGLEWFVEAVTADGTRPVAGEPGAPLSAMVEDVRPPAPRKVLGQAQISTDYARFNTKMNNDYAWQTEGVMGARFDDIGVRAVRTGFGVFRGVGGSLEELDVRKEAGRAVGLTYGYLEGEIGFAPTLSLAMRGIIGLQQDGVSGGTSAFVRIGSDLSTNLLLGGEVLGGIGLRGIAEFNWASFHNWPIVLRSEVTNQPAGLGGDVGVRLIGQVGYRVLPHLVLSARASYQGRTIDHAGPGAGAAVGYLW